MVKMAMSNFTLKGKRIQVIARLRNEKPMFDLDICGEMLIEGAEYNDLLKEMETIRTELEELSSYWRGAGAQLAEFDNLWRNKGEEANADGE